MQLEKAAAQTKRLPRPDAFLIVGRWQQVSTSINLMDSLQPEHARVGAQGWAMLLQNAQTYIALSFDAMCKRAITPLMYRTIRREPMVLARSGVIVPAGSLDGVQTAQPVVTCL